MVRKSDPTHAARSWAHRVAHGILCLRAFFPDAVVRQNSVRPGAD